MIDALRNAFRLPDLRRKILITLGILVIYRFAAHIPVPGTDPVALKRIFEQNSLLGLLNMLSGGAMQNFSVMAMGVYPYITASIIIQLLIPIIPAWSETMKEGDAGRRKMNLWTLWLTIPLALLQAYGQTAILARPGATQAGAVISKFGITTYPLQTTVILASLTAGTMLAIWLGQIITEEGIGNGVSIIIFGGIVAQMPANIQRTWVQGGILQLIVFVLITVLTVAVIVLVQEGQRRIPVQYGKRVRAIARQSHGDGRRAEHARPAPRQLGGHDPVDLRQQLPDLPSTIASYFVNSPNELIATLATRCTASSTGIAGRTGSCTLSWSSRSRTSTRT